MTDKRNEMRPDDDRIATGKKSTLSTQHTVIAGESLSKIAAHYYGDAAKWEIIYEANKALIGANPDLLKAGQVLKVPKLD